MASHDKSISSLRIKNTANSRGSLRSVRNVCELISRAPVPRHLSLFSEWSNICLAKRNGTNCGKRCSRLRIRREISKPLKRQREPKPCTGRTMSRSLEIERWFRTSYLTITCLFFFFFLLFEIGYADLACDSTGLKSTFPSKSSFLIESHKIFAYFINCCKLNFNEFKVIFFIKICTLMFNIFLNFT